VSQCFWKKKFSPFEYHQSETTGHQQACKDADPPIVLHPLVDLWVIVHPPNYTAGARQLQCNDHIDFNDETFSQIFMAHIFETCVIIKRHVSSDADVIIEPPSFVISSANGV
jgi:pyocin large subunit-like protein